jgi:hypothetical protein
MDGDVVVDAHVSWVRKGAGNSRVGPGLSEFMTMQKREQEREGAQPSTRATRSEI